MCVCMYAIYEADGLIASLSDLPTIIKARKQALDGGCDIDDIVNIYIHAYIHVSKDPQVTRMYVCNNIYEADGWVALLPDLPTIVKARKQALDGGYGIYQIFNMYFMHAYMCVCMCVIYIRPDIYVYTYTCMCVCVCVIYIR